MITRLCRYGILSAVFGMVLSFPAHATAVPLGWLDEFLDALRVGTAAAKAETAAEAVTAALEGFQTARKAHLAAKATDRVQRLSDMRQAASVAADRLAALKNEHAATGALYRAEEAGRASEVFRLIGSGNCTAAANKGAALEEALKELAPHYHVAAQRGERGAVEARYAKQLADSITRVERELPVREELEFIARRLDGVPYRNPATALCGSEDCFDCLSGLLPDSIRSFNAGFGRFDVSPASLEVIASMKNPPLSVAVVGEGADARLYLQRGGGIHALRPQSESPDMWKALPAEEAQEAFRQHCLSAMVGKSTEQMRLFGLTKRSSGYEVYSPSGTVISITNEELKQLRAGSRFAPEHPLTRMMEARGDGAMVLWSNPLMAKPGVARAAADEFVFAAQRAYADVPLFRDPLTDETPRRVERLNGAAIPSPADVHAVIADKSFNVQDGKVINNLKGRLKARGVGVSVFNLGNPSRWVGGSGRTVIVMTGHSAPELVAFVHELGKAGYFEGNYVLFNSCQTPLTAELVEEIGRTYKAIGTNHYQGTISAGAVGDFLRDLSESLKNLGENRVQPRKRFIDLLRETANKFGLNSIWTVCWNSMDYPNREGERHA